MCPFESLSPVDQDVPGRAPTGDHVPPETTVPPETEELSLLDAGERLAMLWRVLVAGSGILLLALLGAA